MRCDEVIRELAAPTVDRDRAAIAGHLSGCPACAAWARRAEGLDRLWEETRPVEPSSAAWDAVWAKVAQALPCPAPSPALALVHSEDPTAGGAVPSRNGVGPMVVVHPAAAPASASTSAGRRTRGRVWGFVLIGLAQAAAVLVALGLAWRTPDGPRDPKVVAGPQHGLRSGPVAIRSERPVEVKAEFEASCLMVIHLDGKSGRVEDMTPPEMNVSSDVGMVITNEMEYIATPRVAAQ